MSQIVASDEMVKQLAEAEGPVKIVDSQGRMIGYCTPMRSRPAKNYTPEEIEHRRMDLAAAREEFRKHPEKCKTLKEIMANLQKLGGEAT